MKKGQLQNRKANLFNLKIDLIPKNPLMTSQLLHHNLPMQLKFTIQMLMPEKN